MKKLTKIISLLAVMLMLLSLLSGCITVNNPAPEESTTIEEKVDEQAGQAEQNTDNATQQPQTDNAGQQTQNAGANNTEGIGEDAALDIALKDAGFSKSDVSNPWVELDMDDGRMEYDVKFYNGTTEYEYSIDVNNGTILSKDIDND